VVDGLQNAVISSFRLILSRDRHPFDIVEVFRVELDFLA
jgi:hypothetical protein